MKNNFWIVSNICGKFQNKYSKSLWESYNTNIKIDPDLNYYYKEGTPDSEPSYVKIKEEKEGFSYLSKYYCILDCINEKNPEYVVWLDSTIRFGHSSFYEKTKNIMDKNGVMLISDENKGQEFWTSDIFFRTIRQERNSFKMPKIIGGAFGIKLSHTEGKRFLDFLKFFSNIPAMWFGPSGLPWSPNDIGDPRLSTDTRVKGHRHDQCIFSYISLIGKFNLHDNNSDKVFYSQSYINEQFKLDKKNNTYKEGKSYHFPFDAALIHHPTEFHMNGTLRD